MDNQDLDRIHQLLDQYHSNAKFALARLDPMQQTAICLSYDQKRDQREIAKILGLTDSAAHSLYRQSLHALINSLQHVPLNRIRSSRGIR